MIEYYKIKNYRCIGVKFLGPTNTQGSRIKVFEEDKDGKVVSKIFSYNYEISDIGEQAYNILVKNGFKVICKSCLHDRDLILCDNWGDDFIEIKDLKV